jgi:hypothetical protein
MWTILVVLTLADASVSEYVAKSPEERFQIFVRQQMGNEGCPDVARRGAPQSKVVATIVPHPPTGGPTRKIVIDISYSNTSRATAHIEKRYVVDRRRTDNLWIYDRSSKRWLSYLGPHGRVAPTTPSDFVALGPGEARVLKDVDITSYFDFPKDLSGLVAKVMFGPSSETGPRIESKCTPLTPAGAR